MSKLLLGLIIGFVVLFGSCGALVCIGVLTEDDPDVQKKKAEERKLLLEKTTKQLIAIRTGFPASLVEKACPDASILDETVAHTADFDALERFTKAGVDPERPPLKGWAWLNSASIRDLKPLPQIKEPLHSWELDGMVSGLEALQKGRYLVVFRANKDAKEMPSLTGENAFAGGLFEGWAVVYDLQSSTAVCQAPLKAESSDSVTSRKGLITGKSGDEAIEQDFQEQFEAAARASLGRISKKLRIEL